MRTIDEQVEKYLFWGEKIRHFTPDTLHDKRAVLRYFTRDVRIEDMSELTNDLLEQWVAYQSHNGVGGRTINNRMAHVVAFIKYLRDHGHAVPVIVGDIQKANEKPPRRVYFTPDKIEAALQKATLQERVMAKLTFDAGLRISELAKLRLDDVSGRMIWVIGKGQKREQVYITPATAALLRFWIEKENINNWLFPSPKSPGSHMSVSQIRRILYRPFHAAGMKDFYPHALRHSHATTLQENGAPLMVIQNLMRHTFATTTQVYLHGLDKNMEEKYHQYFTYAKD